MHGRTWNLNTDYVFDGCPFDGLAGDDPTRYRATSTFPGAMAAHHVSQPMGPNGKAAPDDSRKTAPQTLPATTLQTEVKNPPVNFLVDFGWIFYVVWLRRSPMENSTKNPSRNPHRFSLRDFGLRFGFSTRFPFGFSPWVLGHMFRQPHSRATEHPATEHNSPDDDSNKHSKRQTAKQENNEKLLGKRRNPLSKAHRKITIAFLCLAVMAPRIL